MIKLSAIFLLLGISSFFAIGCGPNRPPLTFCLIRANKEVPDVRCQDPEGKQFTLTLKQADKFIAQPPRDAERLRNYVLDLEKDLANCR